MRMTRLLARFVASRPWLIVATSVLLLAIAVVVGGRVTENVVPYSAQDPGSGSVLAAEAFEDSAGFKQDPGIVVLIETPLGARSAQAAARVESVARTLRPIKEIARIVKPSQGVGATQYARDGRSVYVTAHFRPVADQLRQDVAAEVVDRLAVAPWAIVGGTDTTQTQINTTAEEDLTRAEMISLPIVLLLALWFFRSPVAALLPPLVGGCTIVLTLLALQLLTGITDVSVFALNLATGLGLGLAIDYSLFVVSRFREERARGGSDEEILFRTLDHAGRTVLISAVTVSAALAGLLVFPQNFLRSMGFAGVAVPLLAALTTIVLLPAVLRLLGARLDALAPKRLRTLAVAQSTTDTEGRWYRVAQFVRRRPVSIAIVTAGLLLAFGAPFLNAKFILADARVLPTDQSARVVFDRIAEDFPPPVTNAASVVIPAAALTPQTALALERRIRQVPGVAAVAGPIAAGPEATTFLVVPRGDPLSDAATATVREIRTLPSPAGTHVGGVTATFIDQADSISEHLPTAVAIIALVTSLAIFLMTGSVVLPLKTFAINALTVSASFGLLVIIFQNGRLEGLLNYESSGALDLNQPVLIMALVFGLSTDYGVFLLSRIKEARDAGAPEDEAVAIGLERTGRIVTAAALMFCVAVMSFATSDIAFLKQIGIGTAFAVFIDATIVRTFLVPALMALLGKANWWAPAPLRRLHDRIGISEGGSAASPSAHPDRRPLERAPAASD